MRNDTIVFCFASSLLGDSVTLCEASRYKVKDGMSYAGDNWRVSLVIENRFIDRELSGNLFPRALEGEGYGIIEDCSGTGSL